MSASPQAPMVRAQPEPSKLHSVAMGVLAIYVFLVYSRALEFLAVGGVISVTLAVLMLLTLAMGDIRGLFAQSTTRWWLLYLAWFMFTILFSTWRGGSFTIFQSRALHSFAGYMAIVALVQNRKHLKWLTITLVLGNTFIGIMGLVGPIRALEGRLIVGYGTFADPNALAMYTLFGLPFAWLLAQQLPTAFRIIPLASACLPLLVFGKSGSRGGLVALAVMLAYHFWKSQAATKIRLVVGTAVVLSIAAFTLPQYIVLRFMTFFSVGDGASPYAQTLEGNDVGSAQSRKDIAEQAFDLTLANPLVGVGAGEFGNQVYAGFKSGDGVFINTSTHNTFLQVSSEMGIPALILFLMASMGCFFSKPKWTIAGGVRAVPVLTRDQANLLHYTRLAILTIYVFGVSLSFAYDDLIMIAVGIMVATVNVVSRELSSTPAKVPVKAAAAFAPRPQPEVAKVVSSARRGPDGKRLHRLRGETSANPYVSRQH